MDEARQRLAKAMMDAEAAKMAPDEVRAMERAAGHQGWRNGQRLDAWPSFPEDETDNRVCHVSVEALAEAMRMRRIERDGSPCWSTVEARELLEEAMRCELEPLQATVGWMQATHAKRARDRKRAAKARED